MSEMLSSSLAYASRGWGVFPLHGIVRGRCTCGHGDCSSPGKHPLVRRGLHEATTEKSVIKEWWNRWRCANIGLVTGTDSGIVVIDIDLPLALDSLGSLVGRVPMTLTGLTGGGGLHLLLGAPEDRRLHNHTSRLPGLSRLLLLGRPGDDSVHDRAIELPGVDLRAEGGYIVAPPSRHVSGTSYSWLDLNQPVAVAPDWLREPERRLTPTAVSRPAELDGDGTPYGLAILRNELDRIRASKLGTRNHQLNRSAFALARLVAGGELLEHAARQALLIKGEATGLAEWECRQTIDSAFDAGLLLPRHAPRRSKT